MIFLQQEKDEKVPERPRDVIVDLATLVQLQVYEALLATPPIEANRVHSRGLREGHEGGIVLRSLVQRGRVGEKTKISATHVSIAHLVEVAVPRPEESLHTFQVKTFPTFPLAIRHGNATEHTVEELSEHQRPDYQQEGGKGRRGNARVPR